MEKTPFHEFLTQLLDQGKIVFRSSFTPRDRPSPAAVAALAGAFETVSLAVAGPPIAFHPEVACAAAEFLRQSSWALVSRHERMTELEERLKMPCTPLTPSEHLSADVTLRYLPQVMRRARGLDPSDPLVEHMANVLRRWPLSGVLSDIEAAPLAPLEFGRHPGLLLLFAERLAAHDRPGWRPQRKSPAWDFHELVSDERDARRGNS
jgi:MoxR-vWA-beta-propeller ternary system domain bpX4